MDTINEMSLSSRTLTKKEESEKINKNSCSICYENLDKNNLVITKCNHYYCVDCSLKSIRFSDRCAYCREELKPADYARITDHKNSKLKILESCVSDSTKNLVICNNSSICCGLSNYCDSWKTLPDRNRSDFIDEFNQQSSGVIFIDTPNISFVSGLYDVDNIVLFDKLDNSLKQYFINPHIFRDLSKAKLINLVYNGTTEDV